MTLQQKFKAILFGTLENDTSIIWASIADPWDTWANLPFPLCIRTKFKVKWLDCLICTSFSNNYWKYENLQSNGRLHWTLKVVDVVPHSFKQSQVNLSRIATLAIQCHLDLSVPEKVPGLLSKAYKLQLAKELLYTLFLFNKAAVIRQFVLLCFYHWDFSRIWIWNNWEKKGQ